MDPETNSRLAAHELSTKLTETRLHELMKELDAAGVLSKAQLQAVEDRVSDQTGYPRATWI